MRRPSFAPAGALFALAMFLTAPLPAVAQDTGTIVGTVTDASSGRPLESVQVFIEGSGLGTLSNSAGRFLIVGAPTGQLTINAELVGYRASSATVTVSAGQSVVADMTMEQTAIALEEIVVTGAGIATEKKRLGNTIATVNLDELEDQPITDFSQLITGREPGLVGLPSSGTTGEGARIRIRGTASLSQSNEPLVYVDGVRIDNSGGFAPTGTNGSQNLAGGQGNPSRLDDIPPEAIERIEILKGAAAATLYGTEASNGVIQIFTKRGRQGPAQWSFQTDQTAISVPTDRMQPLAGFASDQEQLDRMNQRFNTNLQMYDVHQEDFLPGAFNTGYSQIYSGSVRGGSDAITYFVSGRLAKENGPWEGYDLGPATDESRRIQTTASLNIFPIDNVSVRVSSFYSDSKLETPENSNNIRGAFSSLLMSQLRLAEDPGNIFGQPAFSTFRENLNQLTEDDSEHFGGSVNANWRVREGLVADATFGVDVVNQRSSNFQAFGWNVDGFSTSVPQGQRTIGDRNSEEITGDFKVSWSKDFSDDISSTLLVGAQGFVSQTTASGGQGQNFPGPGLEVAQAGATQTITESWLRVVNAGGYLQEQVGWQDWAFLTLGGRWDANSAFGEDFNTAFYPKASISIVPTDLFDWEGSTVSTLRFRGAVGQSGLQPGAFDQFTTFSPLASTAGAGVQPQNLGNSSLQPEVSTEWELGSEIGFFDDRAAIDVTYWNRTVDDALVARQFPVTGGFRATQLDNIGEIKAWGLEIAAEGSVVNRDGLSLNVFANAAYINEEITDMGGAPPIKAGGSYSRYRNFLREGYAPGAFFGAELNRALDNPFNLAGDCVEPTREEALTYFSEPRDPGDFEVIELGCVPGGAPNLETYLGKPTPDWQGSFGFNLAFLDNFEFTSNFEYKAGNYQVQDLSGMFRRANATIGRNTPLAAEVESILENPASTAEQRLDAAQIWARELRGLAPMAGMNGIYNADWLRWREAALSWRVPQSTIDRLGLSTLTLTAGARNLKLWMNGDYPGMDPENNILGRCSNRLGNNAVQRDCNFLLATEGWGVPIPRRFTFSARLGF